MGFPSRGGAAIAVNGTVIDDTPGEVDFVDSGSVTWLGVLNGQVVEIQGFTGALTPGSVQPGMPGILVSPGGSGPLDTEGKISPDYAVENYKQYYDNGFRLQFRGVWSVDSFISKVGIFFDDGITTGYTDIQGYTPTLTVPQTAYTDWGIVDIPPSVGMADTDPLLIALGAGNDSFFFGWQMVGAWVEYRWVDQNVPPSFSGATVEPGTADGQIPIWADQKEVYEAGAIAVEGVDVLSTGESAGEVLTAQGGGVSAWAAPGGANVGGFSATRFNVQSIPDSTWTDLLFQQEVWDTDGYHAGTSADFTVPTGKGGKYVLCWSVPFLSNAVGVRRATVFYQGSRQGTNETFEVPANASHDTTVNGSCIVNLADGDTIKVQVWQNSGGALDTNPGGSFVTPWFMAMRVG